MSISAQKLDKTRIDVLICTFNRPALLLKTLSGIATLAANDLDVRVIVVDNDEKKSANLVIAEASQTLGLNITYLNEPVQNISMARNRALDAATGDYIAFIDDDEVPCKAWLSMLLLTARQFSADLVFGPVVPEYAPNVPPWIILGGFFERYQSYSTGTPVPWLDTRTGNVLLRRRFIQDSGVRFCTSVGLSGGEDTQFFERLYQRQARAVWCKEAMVKESIPESRSTAIWLIRRKFRIGSVRMYFVRRSRNFLAICLLIAKGVLFILSGVLRFLFLGWLLKYRGVQGLSSIGQGLGIFYGIVFGPYPEYKKKTGAILERHLH